MAERYWARTEVGQWTKADLMEMLGFAGMSMACIGGVEGRFEAIEREDGSGRSFNVRLNVAGVRQWVHIRTVD